MFEPIDWTWRDTIIRNMRRHNDPAHLIASVIKVHTDSLRKRERQLGLPMRKICSNLTKERKHSWARAEVQKLRRLWAENRSVEYIVARLPGRSESSIWMMRRKLNLPSRRVKCDRQLVFSVSPELRHWVNEEAIKARVIRSRYIEGFFLDLMRKGALCVVESTVIDPEWRPHRKWREDEKAILKRLWEAGEPVPAIMKHLPHRSNGSIMLARGRMGLKARPKDRATHHLTFSVRNDLDLWIGRESTRLGLMLHQFLERCLSEHRDRQMRVCEKIAA